MTELVKKVKHLRICKYRHKPIPGTKFYGPSDTCQGYRIAYRVPGNFKRQWKRYPHLSDALSFEETLGKDLATGSQVTALTAKQARDALAALEVLEGFSNTEESAAYATPKAAEASPSPLQKGRGLGRGVARGRLSRGLGSTTQRAVSLFSGISNYCASGKLVPEGRSMREAIEGWLSTVAKVTRVDIDVAVKEFIARRKLKTVAVQGRRPQLSPEHACNTALWFQEFADTFPGQAVCDLSKDHLDNYMQHHVESAPMTRNERRGLVKMFLRWCVEKDYLSRTHRLFEAGGLKHEPTDLGEIECYSAKELQALLERASKQPGPVKDGEDPERDFRDLLPVVALAGLAELRFKEVTRMVWEDVLGRTNHIEVKAAKSKTRSCRLIPTCAALIQWLKPYRSCTGLVWPKGYDMLHEAFADLRESVEVPARQNGLRHSFISAYFAAHSDENLTVAQAGNSPAVIQQHYKGLLTRKEGKAWFAVKPAKSSAKIIDLPVTAEARA